jgi:hypothetical protein
MNRWIIPYRQNLHLSNKYFVEEEEEEEKNEEKRTTTR